MDLILNTVFILFKVFFLGFVIDAGGAEAAHSTFSVVQVVYFVDQGVGDFFND